MEAPIAIDITIDIDSIRACVGSGALARVGSARLGVRAWMGGQSREDRTGVCGRTDGRGWRDRRRNGRRLKRKKWERERGWWTKNLVRINACGVEGGLKFHRRWYMWSGGGTFNRVLEIRR